MHRILLIEDDEAISEMVRSYLVKRAMKWKRRLMVK